MESSRQDLPVQKDESKVTFIERENLLNYIDHLKKNTSLKDEIIKKQDQLIQSYKEFFVMPNKDTATSTPLDIPEDIFRDLQNLAEVPVNVLGIQEPNLVFEMQDASNFSYTETLEKKIQQLQQDNNQLYKENLELKRVTKTLKTESEKEIADVKDAAATILEQQSLEQEKLNAECAQLKEEVEDLKKQLTKSNKVGLEFANGLLYLKKVIPKDALTDLPSDNKKYVLKLFEQFKAKNSQSVTQQAKVSEMNKDDDGHVQKKRKTLA